MITEEKQLLLKDLCARLPYFENWVQFEGKDYVITGYGHGRVSLLSSPYSSAVGPCPLIEEVKPYLRSMSSMTEEEKSELQNKFCYGWDYKDEGIWDFFNHHKIYGADAELLIDWLISHHFDYRGLIEKSLALVAPEDMYKYEND